jgi:hypothetical protein
MEHEPKAGKTVSAGNIALQRRLNERERRIEPPAPVVDLPKAMQRVEIVGALPEELSVEPLGFAELAFFVRAPCAPKRPRKIRLQVSRRPQVLRWLQVLR